MDATDLAVRIVHAYITRGMGERGTEAAVQQAREAIAEIRAEVREENN